MTNNTHTGPRPFAPILTVPGRWHDVTLECTSSREACDLTPGGIRSFRVMGDMFTDTYSAATYYARIIADCQACMLRATYGATTCARHTTDVWFNAR